MNAESSMTAKAHTARKDAVKEPGLVELVRGDFWRLIQIMDLYENEHDDFYAAAAAPTLPHPVAMRRRVKIFLMMNFIAVILIRVMHSAHRHHVWFLPRVLRDLHLALYGNEIDPGVVIGPGFFIGHQGGNTIVAGVRIGRNVSVLGKVAIGRRGYPDTTLDGSPTIGDNVWLMHGACVWGPIIVGSGTRVGANATLMESVPPGSIVVAPKSTVIVNPPPGW